MKSSSLRLSNNNININYNDNNSIFKLYQYFNLY